MTKKFVIDSCVFMKLFLEEDDDKIAEKLLIEAIKNYNQIYVPSIFIYEISNIAANKNLDLKHFFSILEKYEKSVLKIIEPSADLLKKSIKMAKSGNTKSDYPSVYDCIYHVLAIEKNCVFITSDHKHYAKAKKFSFIKLLKDYGK